MKDNKPFIHVNNEDINEMKTSFRISSHTEFTSQKMKNHKEHQSCNRSNEDINIIKNLCPDKSSINCSSIAKSSNKKKSENQKKHEKSEENDVIKLLKYQIEKVSKVLLMFVIH